MPAKNVYHDVVKEALVSDGWLVTDDPLRLSYGKRNLFVDLAAELVIGAERNGRRIAVEIQSFLGRSEVSDFESAIGQYMIYQTVLGESQPDRVLYLAIHREVAEGIFSEPFGRLITSRQGIKVLVFDESTRRILEWIE